MSSILNQAKLDGWVVHPVQQRVTRWAENPNLFWRRVRSASVRPVTSMLWPMGYIQNPRIAAGLTFARSLRMASVEPFQVSVWPKSFSGLRAKLARLYQPDIGKEAARLLNDGTPWDACPWDAPASAVCSVDDGISDRVVETERYGNSVLPQIPEIIGRAIMQAEGLTAA